MATATTDPVRLPPGPPIPKIFQGIVLLTALQYRMFPALSRRYGSTFTVNVPIFGKTVVVSDPILVKDVFSTADDLIERPTKILGQAFGPGSTFSLTGEEHLARRKLVLPAFHTKRARGYERIVEEEVMRETRNWPEGREFETLPSMTRLTLNSILRAAFGEEGPELDELRSLIPPMITIGSLLHLLPEIVGRDFGRWSPGARLLRDRRRFDAIIDLLLAKARADPALAERSDVLAILLQARYENGEPISDRHIADELLTLVAAGHETTASQLAWAVERLRRHPRLLSRLADEVDASGSALRLATIYEVQRTRSTIEAALRCTKERIRLGDWVIPTDTNIMVNFQLAHESEDNFPEADSFNPDRFLGTSPKPFRWIPYGGGVNRCVGAGFAAMEMDITLRTLLREFRFAPTDAPDEGRNYRGVAIAPRRGARAVVYRRTAAVSTERDSVSATDQRMAATDHITDIGLRLFKAVQNKYWYPFLTRRLEAEDLTCLNYGYEEDPPMGLPLATSEESNRLGIQLYHRVASQADLNGKQVLEVSCGHGGGAAYLAHTLRPASYTGLDFNSAGIALCQRRHGRPGLDFVHGDAERLPFADKSFDAVINIEASHTYPRLSRFLAEVMRVLRPGGRFLYADFRGSSEFPGWEAALADAQMRQVSERVINPEVLRGLNKNAQRSVDLVGRLLPAFLRPFGRRFAGVPGTGLYRDIESGKIEYRMYCFAKD